MTAQAGWVPRPRRHCARISMSAPVPPAPRLSRRNSSTRGVSNARCSWMRWAGDGSAEYASAHLRRSSGSEEYSATSRSKNTSLFDASSDRYANSASVARAAPDTSPRSDSSAWQRSINRDAGLDSSTAHSFFAGNALRVGDRAGACAPATFEAPMARGCGMVRYVRTCATDIPGWMAWNGRQMTTRAGSRAHHGQKSLEDSPEQRFWSSRERRKARKRPSFFFVFSWFRVFRGRVLSFATPSGVAA